MKTDILIIYHYCVKIIYLRFSPVFDNGLSLLSNLDKYPMHDKKIGVAMRSARSKPFCKVFKNQVDLFREYVNPLVINVDLLQQKLSTIEACAI